MKKSSLIVLIVAIAVVLVCTGLGAAYLLTNHSTSLALEGVGDTFSEEVAIDGLVPGQERTCSYKGKTDAPADFTVTLTGDDGALTECLSVRVEVGDTVVCEGALADVLGKEYRAKVEGEFSFTVTYSMAEEVGNEAQGAACKVTAQYRLEGVSA